MNRHKNAISNFPDICFLVKGVNYSSEKGITMRYLFMLTSFLIWVNQPSAQIINAGINEWEVIQTIGQPFENPVGWKTNNYTDYNGFASTPVIKVVDPAGGYFAKVESNLHGIDGSGPGELWQTISTDHLTKIDFYAHCDSIFQVGRCIVSILGQDPLDVLFIDSIPVDPTGFTLNSIHILNEWSQENDSITIRFTAKGNMDIWDEKEDGYSIFKVDNVTAQYITGSEEISKPDDLIIFPNPSSGIINLVQEDSGNPMRIEMYSIMGEAIFKSNYFEILDLNNFPNGVYLIKILSGTRVYNEVLIIEK
ncbi:MAG TPA: T9SS type A sorting domain-containing protein [Saprospiraceae bacterium]|nr:T9SS type A sorting domain-containing protein [Saprospiraceae bacterium]